MTNKNKYDQLKQYEFAINQSSIVARTDQNGTITYVNNNFCKISGYSEEELIGKNHKIINSQHHDKSFFKNLWNTILSGEQWRGEIKNRAKDGNYYWVDTFITPIKNEANEIVEFIAIRNEITDRKRIEQELYRSNRELSNYAYIISHDLRSPLRGIKNFCEFFMEDYFHLIPKEGKELVITMKKLCEKQENYLNALLDYSRLRETSTDRVNVDLNELIDELIFEVKNQHIEMKVHIFVKNDLPVLNFDVVKARQIFLNILQNAVMYNTSSERRIEIDYWKDHGQHIISISDNGIGIKENNLEKIFTIFSRLSDSQKYHDGMGMGLSMVKQAVKQLEGDIWVESELGKGSVFYLKFPNF